MPDEVWEPMTARFSVEDQGTLVALVAMINLWNRVCVPTRRRAPSRPVPEGRAS